MFLHIFVADAKIIYGYNFVAPLTKGSRFSIFKWNYVIVDGAVSSNPLIVWNNPFGVDDPFTEKPVA